MSTEFLEAGKIVNTHGTGGELKVQPWSDEPDFLCGFSEVYVNGQPLRVRQARVHQNYLLMTLEGVDSIDEALRYKNKVLCIRRADAPLTEGEYYVADLIGLEARDAATGAVLGRVTDILNYPAHDLYVIDGETRHYVPDVPAFVRGIHADEGYISFSLLEGL